MKYRIWIVSDAANLTDAGGCWLKSCDVDARDGRGHVDMTTDVAEAIEFPSFAAAMEYWRRPSAVRPVRPDGRPNRPLTAYTIEPRPILAEPKPKIYGDDLTETERAQADRDEHEARNTRADDQDDEDEAEL